MLDEFFNNKMAAIEVCKAASGNTGRQNRFPSANAATKIMEELKSVTYNMKSEQDTAVQIKDAENALAIRTLSGKHEAKMSKVRT